MRVATTAERKPDAEAKHVNRRAAIVRVKQPFYEWAKSVADENAMPFTLEDLRRHPTIWLLPLDENPEEFIRREFYILFLHELSQISGNRWPLNRNDPEIFNEWFEVEIIHSVGDLGDKELKSWR